MFRLTFPQRDMAGAGGLRPDGGGDRQRQERARLEGHRGRNPDDPETRTRPGRWNTTCRSWTGSRWRGCSTSTARRCCSSRRRARPATRIAPSASAGRSLSGWRARSSRCARASGWPATSPSTLRFRMCCSPAGDPLIMKTKTLREYIEPLIEQKDQNHLRTIRIGSKAIAYWPHRFIYDNDADDLLALFKEVVDAGLQLALMAHFTHPVELRTEVSLEAVRRIRATGAQIRTQDAAAEAHQQRLAAARRYVGGAGAGRLRALLPVRGARHRREALLRAAAGRVPGDLPSGLQPGQRRGPDRARPRACRRRRARCRCWASRSTPARR